jgi:hypothetical protein
MANQDIDHFIRSLNYDPRIILAVAPDGDVSTLPLTTSQTGNNEVVVCKTIQHKLTKNLSEVAILSQGAVAFPGALLVADAHLQSGAPTPIGIAAHGGGESGPVTAGWTTTVWIPGTARDVELRGEADTGIVWNRWQEIGDIRNPEPTKTYTAVGTKLIGRQFEVSG